MPPPLTTIAREWGRIGCVGFGGPPAHIALLRELCVQRRGWISAHDFRRAMRGLCALDMSHHAQREHLDLMFDHEHVDPQPQQPVQLRRRQIGSAHPVHRAVHVPEP